MHKIRIIQGGDPLLPNQPRGFRVDICLDGKLQELYYSSFIPSGGSYLVREHYPKKDPCEFGTVKTLKEALNTTYLLALKLISDSQSSDNIEEILMDYNSREFVKHKLKQIDLFKARELRR